MGLIRGAFATILGLTVPLAASGAPPLPVRRSA